MEELIKTSNDNLYDALNIGQIRTINEPRASFIVGGNIGISTWVYGALFGLASGVLFCLLRFIFAATVINGIDMEEVFDLDLLAVLPYDKEYARTRSGLTTTWLYATT